MAKDKKDDKKEKPAKAAKSPDQIEAEKAAKAAKKAEHAAASKIGGKGAAQQGGGEKPRSGKREADEPPAPFPSEYTPRLLQQYRKDVAPALMKDFSIENKHAVPTVTKVVLSMGLGKAIAERPRLEAAIKELTSIAGQKAVVCRAKKSVSNFKLREGMEIGAKVTLRGRRMWEFLDRLIILAIPRVKDFRGLSPTGFDGRGNYNMGLTEQTVFPEVNADVVTFHQGMNITIVTDAGEDKSAHALLKHLGMPFRTAEAQAAIRKAG